MRGEQLSQITQKYINKNKYNITFRPFTTGVRDSIVIMSKMTILEATVPQLIKLKKRNNYIVYDPNDGILHEEKKKYADAWIASSVTGYRALKDAYPTKRVFLVNHHVDPRIEPKNPKELTYQAGYFGEPANTILSKKIEEFVDVLSVSTASQDELGWLDVIQDYPMHYAVRKSRGIDGYKPATKIFTAAKCGANVIVQDSEEEARLWLTDDYPYLIKGAATEKSIIEMLRYAKKTYNTDVWQSGLDIMRSINYQVSEQQIGESMVSVIEEIC